MIKITGKWYDGKTSHQISALLKVFDNGAIRIEEEGNGRLLYENSRLLPRISSRLADTPRLLSFPGGSLFETEDNFSIDGIVAKFSQRKWSRWIHLLESRKRYVLLAAALVFVIMAMFVKYGIPAAADIISRYLPRFYYELADREVIRALDQMFMKPSELPPHIEKQVRDNLKDSLFDHQAHQVKLLFKKGGALGPNAFALPGGTIVFTDELVELAENEEELIAVLAHEIGHVVHRHGMRRMVQDSLLSFAILSLTGDASGISEIFLGLPAVLTELAYSREFERAADQYALTYLRSRNIPAKRFAEFLIRLDKSSKRNSGEDKEKWAGYLSTHPPTLERVKAFLD